MTRIAKASSPITKLIHKHIDTSTLSLVAISAARCIATSELSVLTLKDIVAAAGLHIKNSDISQIAKYVSTLLARLATYQCDPSSTNGSVLLLALNAFTGEGMNRHDCSDRNKFIRGFLTYIYPYILGEKELFVGKCLHCGKMFYKSSKNKTFCSDSCASILRGRRYRERLSLINKKGCSK